MNLEFYCAFEERFRGSRELIKSRLQIYLPFIAPLKDIYPDTRIIDLGCGRGEWLEVLAENGFSAQGVDLSEAMVGVCQKYSLRATLGEALSFLKTLPDESQAVVSGFHLVEHISFEDLEALVKESLRVLKPSGLLILETPNPENIIVGTSSFYLDPSHQKPIPPQLLAFLPEYHGFRKVKILRLQDPEEPDERTDWNLRRVLNGVSPDYAVVAQKGGPAKLLDAIAPAFDVEYGLTLETVVDKYQQQVETRVIEVEARIAKIETRVTELLNSPSWRFTAPLRWVESAVHRLTLSLLNHRAKVLLWLMALLRWSKSALREFTPSALAHRAKMLLRRIAFYVSSRPRLKKAALGVLNRFPTLKYRLERIVNGASVIPAVQHNNVPANLAELSPQARRIYRDLKAAIGQRRKVGD